MKVWVLSRAVWLTSHLLRLRGSFKGLGQKGDLAAVLRLHNCISLFDSSLWFWRSPIFSGKYNGGSLGTSSAFLSVKSEESGLSQQLAWLVCHTKVVGNPVLWCLTFWYLPCSHKGTWPVFFSLPFSQWICNERSVHWRGNEEVLSRSYQSVSGTSLCADIAFSFCVCCICFTSTMFSISLFLYCVFLFSLFGEEPVKLEFDSSVCSLTGRPWEPVRASLLIPLGCLQWVGMAVSCCTQASISEQLIT